jgi:hypothetical protein
MIIILGCTSAILFVIIIFLIWWGYEDHIEKIALRDQITELKRQSFKKTIKQRERN